MNPRVKSWGGTILLLLAMAAAAYFSSGHRAPARRTPDPVSRQSTGGARQKDSQPDHANPPDKHRAGQAGEIGFASRGKLLDHYRKHGREFGSISMADYLRKAQNLRDRQAGGDVLEYVRADGVVTRFDRAGGAFIAFNPDRTIRTFFRPNDGEAYFRRQMQRSER